jgi:hypothetical protein
MLRAVISVAATVIALVIAVTFMIWPVLADARHWFPRKKTKKITGH